MNRMKKAVSLAAALVLMLGCACAFAAGNGRIRYEGQGFATPEDALACYMEGLKNLDFEQMMSAFAITISGCSLSGSGHIRSRCAPGCLPSMTLCFPPM